MKHHINCNRTPSANPLTSVELESIRERAAVKAEKAAVKAEKAAVKAEKARSVEEYLEQLVMERRATEVEKPAEIAAEIAAKELSEENVRGEN